MFHMFYYYIFRIPRAVFSVRELFLRNYKRNPLPPNFSIANKFSYTLYNEKISYNQTILTPPPPPPLFMIISLYEFQKLDRT